MAGSVGTMDAMLLMREMADLAGGGLTLHRCLDILRRQNHKPAVCRLIADVQQELEKGQSLSHALSLQNGTFSAITVGLVRAGESSGALESALEESAALLENEMDTRQRIRSAFAYPAFLLVVAVAVCVFLTVFVIPRFEFLFADLGQQLPLPTRLLIGTSVFIKTYAAPLALIIGGSAYGLAQAKPRWKARLPALALSVPGVAELLRATFLQRWARILASLLKNGFTVSDALALSARALNNPLVARELNGVLERLHEGRSIQAALESSPLFPPAVCELVGAGEESGSLEQSFQRIAASYKRQTELRSKLFLSMLEPALLLGMAAIVGFVAVAMLLPIFQMSASFQ